MKLIKPAEISSKIMTLIDEADEKLIIVSPYNDLREWPKLMKRFNNAIQRNIKIYYYVREGVDHKGIQQLGINPIEIKNLHAKIYMNEKYAIVTSMNLHRFSDAYSLDIGYYIDDKNHLDELKAFYNRYISKYKTETKNNQNDSYKNPKNGLDKSIRKEPLYTHKNRRYKYEKVYYPNNNFIKHFGYLYKNKRQEDWYYFDENGFVKSRENYDVGQLRERKDIEYEYDSSVSRYDTIFSLANIVGGLYRVSIKDLYFNSYINDYISDNKQLLYNHLENTLGIKFDQVHETFQELVDDIHWFIETDIKEIKNEIAFQDYIYQIDKNFKDYDEYFKEYYEHTFFIKKCGFIKNGSKNSVWLYFDEKGFCKKEEIYINGDLKKRNKVNFNNGTSLYFIIISLANIVGGIYKKSIKDIYFDTWINSCTNRNQERLYNYLESNLKINLNRYRHDLFKELASDIKYLL